ncbi:MAG: ankyrin repeat domain-containing protein [Simkaniaceae bacterium]|nr:ankyrin repeat domain-containing protein [Simkaniaceae bacterium]
MSTSNIETPQCVPIFAIPDTANFRLAEGIMTRNLTQILQALDDGANPRGTHGISTMLHLAASCANLPAVQLLIEAGAQIDARNRLGNLPIHSAVIADAPTIVACLLEHGSPSAPQNVYGITPRMAAERCHSTKCTKILPD